MIYAVVSAGLLVAAVLAGLVELCVWFERSRVREGDEDAGEGEG